MNTFDRQRAQRDLPPRENSTPVDRKPVRQEKKRIYVELRSTDEEVQMFLTLCAERQLKFIIHLRPALDDRRLLRVLIAIREEIMTNSVDLEKLGYIDLKRKILAAFVPLPIDNADLQTAQKNIENQFNFILHQQSITLDRNLQAQLLAEIIDDTIGLGPLEPLLRDPEIVEIMVEHYDQIYIDRAGQVVKVPQRFQDEAQLMTIIERIATPNGRRVDESHPVVDLRLFDGSRVNVVIPPIALDGPVMNIRKFTGKQVTVEGLLQTGSCTAEIWGFLEACVRNRLNIAISGGSGAGKTTLLNLLIGAIPPDERIIALQYAGELQFNQPRVIRLETRPPNLEGRGEVSMRDLVINSLKMRPDRIIVGDIYDGEALDLFEAMKTGHDGCIFTSHAGSPRDLLARLEVQALMGNPAVPVLSIRESMTIALDLVVHCELLRDGSRRIRKVTEVTGMQGDVVTMQDIFEFKTNRLEAGKMGGYFTATGNIPEFLDRIPAGSFPDTMFRPLS